MKGKSFAAGLLIGMLIATTITVSAAGRAVTAWLSDELVNINVDGENIVLTEDMHILEYDGRYYVPTRLVAERLGATVDWLESRKAIYIKSAEPVREIIEVEKIVEKEPTETYSKVPVRLKINDVTMNIFGISRGGERTYIYLDVENRYGLPIYFDHDNAYIMIDGVQYKTIHNNNTMWGWSNSLGSGDDIREGEMVFEGVPNKVYDMKIVIPVIFESYNYESKTTHVFEMNVTFEN